MTTKEFWIAKGVRTVNGKAIIVWLQYHHKEGVYQWGLTFETSHPLNTREAILEAARRCPGPWYNDPDKSTIEALKVTYTPPSPAVLELVGER